MSVLLPAFHFDRTGDVVDWRLGITLSPYVRRKGRSSSSDGVLDVSQILFVEAEI